ncbi:hypothetical protein Mterra_02427 [Calidithermus terrae]|uniref:VOC domain-containing protein n=1 Tax=Calidithermus terrae TaxID=1408545 RepID=A0A399ELI7_9DEIN|nr:VOC family protein [Calidithermus terrae]RIH83021.1 hypothetical protein Mterra_02427 [Calidithermus terrae]
MRIHQLWLSTGRLAELRAFYAGVLELPVVDETPGAVTFGVGASRLTFEQAAGGSSPFYHFAFNVPEHRFAEAEAWARERVRLIPDAQGQDTFRSENWNAHMLYFYDPAGNIGELIARHTLPGGGGGPFTARSLEGVSEIGVASEDVPATVARLQRRTAAALYRAELNDAFVPVGDEHGLFIVVRRGRVWFPDTGKAAQPAPFRVSVAGPDGAPLTLSDAGL